MDRAVAVADAETVRRRDRGADPGLGVAHGALHVLALREPRGNRRRKRAAGAVGVPGRDARCGECDDAGGSRSGSRCSRRPAPWPPLISTALQPSVSSRRPCFSTAASLRRHRLVEQGRGFRQIGRDHRRQRNESVRSASTASGASRRSPEVATITGSSTTCFGDQRAEPRHDGVDDRRMRHHADLDRADRRDRKTPHRSARYELGRHRMDAADALWCSARSAP